MAAPTKVKEPLLARRENRAGRFGWLFRLGLAVWRVCVGAFCLFLSGAFGLVVVPGRLLFFGLVVLGGA